MVMPYLVVEGLDYRYCYFSGTWRETKATLIWRGSGVSEPLMKNINWKKWLVVIERTPKDNNTEIIGPWYILGCL